MSKSITASSVTILLIAFVLTVLPSLRQYVFSTGVQSISEVDARIFALAAAQKYNSTTVFADPLVIYIDDFLSQAEVDQLLNDSSSLFVPSQVFAKDAHSPQHRTSSSCSLPAADLLPSIISARALSFLDSISGKSTSLTTKTLSYYGLEPLQLVKYASSQYYYHHVDWFDALMRDDLPAKGTRGKGRGRLYNRVASFFLYLKDDCVGGGTEFPDLNLDESTIFAKKRGQAEAMEQLDFWRTRIVIERKENETSEHAQGVIFKPRKGSGVFWVNLHESGFGDQRVRHAGLPVQEGQKVGMNIWVKRDFGW